VGRRFGPPRRGGDAGGGVEELRVREAFCCFTVHQTA